MKYHKKHHEMITEIADRLIYAGYQVKVNYLLKPRYQIKGEIDVLSVDIDSKILGLVEVKTHYSIKNYNKAREQLKREDELLRNYYGFNSFLIAKFYYSNEFKEAYGNTRARKALEGIIFKESFRKKS
jgi:hypothetical protein